MNGLRPREALLLAELRAGTDRWGEVHLTMEELSERTAMSRTTLWRALSTLTELGMVGVRRTRRNFGKLYKNVYTVIEVETSTAGQGSLNDLTTSTANLALICNQNTTYFAYKMREAHVGGLLVNKWNSEEDDLMSFGLIDAVVPQEKVRKVPRTRHLRPQSEWNCHDVATEFAARAYDRVRGIPNMVNASKLGIILGKNRKQHGITADMEMAAMDKFFADEKNILAMRKFPKRSAGIFLNFMTQYVADVSNDVTIETAIAMADQLEYIYASDGKKFLRSISGRAALADYEEELKSR